MVKLSARLVRNFGIVALFLAAALLGTASGVLFAFMGDLPQISALDDYAPPTITKVLARDGSVVGEFATERRELVAYEGIPVVLRNAIIASEDADFFSHTGIDVAAIVKLVGRRVLGMQQRGGASTITQQLARHLFLEEDLLQEHQTRDDLPLERKIKEWLLAIQIDKRYTKQEIFTMYCNKMYWGHGAYGVQAASQVYFGKSVADLNLEEAALIAGLLQGNVRQSPYVNMKAALARRAYVLDRMAEHHFITDAEAKAANNRPIITRGHPNQTPSMAPYFVETVRQHLEDQYGAKAVYENGLVVKTGLDPALQRWSNAALDAGLRRLDKARGYRKPTENVVAEKHSVDTYKLPQWIRDPDEGEHARAIVTDNHGGLLHVRVGKWHGTIDRTGYAWTNRKAEDAAKIGDVVDVKVGKMNAKDLTFTAILDQTPLLEGAVVALDNHTGQVLAMVGGQNFDRSQFNRAIQAQRQVGSLFKVFVYTAAIDRGYTVADILQDEPVSFNPGPNQPPYEPRNFDKKFEGPVTLRWALEDSRNVPTIRLMDALRPEQVIPYARALGITTPIPPYLSTAIGSAEGTLLEFTSAYSAFPNQGVRMAPLLVNEVIDRDGNSLEQHRIEPHESLRADTAYIMTDLMHGVVMHGTAQSAGAQIDWPLGGKTGTTDEFTDAWFIGFDPDITIGVWVGFDLKKQIGPNAQGAVAALPIWMDIMKPWVARRQAELAEKPAFERPNNVVVAMTDHGPDVFITGTEPGKKGQ
ncbi:MAG TPA: PBP1A family penicillin-binding protein [Vicinamibacterales bacterium]|nr:PBP1A family penicillin-binding protein [Vicinamibacterales bacterium]